MGFIERKPIGGSGGGGGKGGGGAAGAVPSEDPNTLRSDSLARILDLVSEGEIEGLVNGAQSIYFDGTQLQDGSGNFNFQGVTWDQRFGLADQDYMAGFSAAEDEVVENVQVLNATPIVRTFSGPVDAIRVTLGIPQLTYQDPSTGDLHGTGVDMLISIRPNGTSTWNDVLPINITGKCVSPYEASYRVELGGSDDWDVKVTRVTADSVDVNLVNQSWWQSATLITDGKFQYNDCGYLGLTVDAQQFGSSIPTRAFDVKGIKVQIPSNYDPIARTYTGLWDGTFTTAWSDNPAWVLYDVLTSKRYGLGNFINAAQVDKWGLYAIAQYCDELVPDGFGNTEPRYTFNYQLATMDDAYKTVQSIASNFSGLTFWSSGLVKVVADMPADPVKLITPANVINGDLTYEGVGFSARHSVALVTWNDPSNLCQPALELVEDPDLINGSDSTPKLGWKPLQLTAYGCTSRGQAHRMGKWALDTERYATQTLNYQAGFDHADVSPGDIIEVYDPDYQALRLGGRIKDSDSNSITTDADISIESGQTYTARLIMPDGSLISRPLTNAPGDTTVLTFDEPLPQQPVAYAMWGLTTSSVSPRLFRVLSVKEGTDSIFTVTALFHDPTKYARVEQNIKLEAPIYSPYTNITVPAISGISYKQYVSRPNGVPTPSVTFSWAAPPATVPVNSFQIQLQAPGQNWGAIISQRGVSYDLIGAVPGLWSVRVRAVGFNGNPGPWTTITALLNVNPDAPDDVSGFSMSLVGHTAILKWDASTDPNHDHYRIKFQPVTTGAVWTSAIDVLPNELSTSASVAADIGTFLIKDVNTGGIESDDAAIIVTTSSALTGIDVVETLDDAPAWGGSKTDLVVASGILKIALNTDGTVKPDGIYQFATYYDLGAVYTARLSGSVSAAGDDISNVMSSWPTLASVKEMTAVAPADWDVQIEIKTTNDDPAGSPTWSDWLPFELGDYSFRAIWPRATLISKNGNINVDVSDIAVLIGMERRTESQSHTSASGGDTITFSPGFYGTPDFIVSPHNMNTGDYFQVTSKLATGCTVQFFNSSGTGVSRDYSIAAVGHGYAT